MVTITLPVKNYLAKYMRVHYEKSTEEGAIRLSSSEIIYHCLHQLTTKRPKGASWKDEGNITLILPHPAIGKSPEVYNYLNTENARILEKKLKSKHSVNPVFFRPPFLLPLPQKKLCGILKSLNQSIPVMRVAV